MSAEFELGLLLLEEEEEKLERPKDEWASYVNIEELVESPDLREK